MSNFFYRRLNFFDKTGSPLNFDYIGPTGPSPIGVQFTFISDSSVSSQGQCSVSQFDVDPGYIQINKNDLNASSVIKWVNYIDDYLLKGADVYLKGRISGQNQFSGKIASVVDNVTYYQINFVQGSISGQRIISLNKQIYFTAESEYTPGGYYKGNIYFDPVSAGLYENQQIFVLQLLETSGKLEYGIPHTGSTGASAGKWRTRWYNDNYGETDVSEIIFTYKIDDTLEGGEGKPLIVSYPNVVYEVDVNPGDTCLLGGYISTSTVNSEALSINVALNASDIASNIYERKLIVEDISSGNPEKVFEVDFYGEIVGEDERLEVMLNNIGRAFQKSDSVILRDHNPEEPLPNYIELNSKRKELLLAGEEIFPYIGSYKGLINALKFFGYQDLRIKEYWLNLEYKSLKLESPLQKTTKFLDAIKAHQSQGYTQSYQVGDVLDNPNSGKYKMTQTYGPDGNGNYVLNVTGEDSIIPTKTYKKTSLFGLYYDLNKTTGEDSSYGYPEVVDAFPFTQEEVLIKLFALKERLKRDYLPLNARIVDITGEGIYFNVYNTKSWTDSMNRPDIDIGFYTDIKVLPDFGFIEDLRNFSVRPLQSSIQTPSSYNDYYQIEASVAGSTGSAIYFSGIPATGPNPTLVLTAGKTYSFNFTTAGFGFYITTDPLLLQVDPLGVKNNGATSGGPNLIWYINPQQTSPVYYYCIQNKTLLTGQIQVLSSAVSDLGNTVDPLSSGQVYGPSQNSYLIDSINEFYYLKQQGEIVELGDSKSDPTSYLDPSTGLPYQNPIGTPIILELIVDSWTWEELNINWSALLIPVFKVGDRVQVKSTGMFGSVTSVSYSNGQYVVLLDDLTVQTFEESLLFSSIQNYSLLTWSNIDYSNMIDIEWIIDKDPTQKGSPYHFEFRGSVVDFNRLAHFIPYTGSYKVTCNIYDAFNARVSAIKNNAIKVDPKIIDIDSWTRYREIETYSWSNIFKGWEDYNSIWEFPAEGQTIQEVEKLIPSEILDFATYGNKANDGQDVYVKINTDPIGATGYIEFTQQNVSITEITSYEIIPGQYSFANILCSTPHGLKTGDEVTIFGTIPQVVGRWRITVPSGSTTSFKIPITINASWNNILILSSPSRLSVNSSFYPNQYFTGSGSISVYVKGRLIGSSEAGDSLYKSANAIVSSINSLITYPDYFASCSDSSADPVKIVISAPDELGSDQNGIPLSSSITGSLTFVSGSTGLTGGVTSTETYVYWSESYDTLPNDNLKYWGTKKLNWDIFTDNSWNNGYAHTWFDFDFTNDWLGGYELHNIDPGDFIKVSTGNEFYPFPIGITAQPGSSGLTVQELSDQLNLSTDPNITNFYYRPIPNESGSLSLNSPPINLLIDNTTIPTSSYPPPPSLIGGSGLLAANFTYTP